MAFLQKFANLSGYSPKLNILVTNNIIPEEIGLDLAIPEIAPAITQSLIDLYSSGTKTPFITSDKTGGKIGGRQL